jgi:hypothetical protein
MIQSPWNPLAESCVCTPFRLHPPANLSSVGLNPSIIDYLVTITARLRWDEANELPQTRVCNIRLSDTATD